MTNNKLTDEDVRISNATLIRLIRWADEHKSHYVAAALRELQEYRKAVNHEMLEFIKSERKGIRGMIESLGGGVAEEERYVWKREGE
ncbi:hypothetical protein ACQVA2_13675 [Citrobacter sp. OP27]